MNYKACYFDAACQLTICSGLCASGAVQESLVEELLKARPCVFRPVHRNKLGNEFMLFTNYDPLDRLGGWEKQANYEASVVQDGS